MRILAIEDDDVLRDGLVTGLGLHGFTVDAVTTACEARDATAIARFEAVVLDLMLPDGDGLDWLAAWRRDDATTPVLILTARDAVDDRVRGLDGGADDYLCKPFDLDELAARLRALLRRRPVASAPATLAGPDGLALDPAELCAWRGGERIPLSRREFAILRALVEHPRAILSKAQLEDRLYGFNEGVGSNAVEVHVHHLRGKLGADAVETVRGVGYRLGRKDGR